MDSELANLKATNWTLWMNADGQAKRQIGMESQSPALIKAPLFAFLYFCSLSLFAALVPPLRNYPWETLIWSCVIGGVMFLHYREKEKRIDELAQSIFRQLLREKGIM